MPYEIVPGVTAAAASSHAGVPLTDQAIFFFFFFCFFFFETKLCRPFINHLAHCLMGAH